MEHDPVEIWEKTKTAIRQVLKESSTDVKDIAAMAITNQRETVVVWDRNTGQLVYNAGKTYGGEGGHYNVVNNYYKRCRSDFCNPSQPNPSETDNEFVGCIYDSIKSYWYVEGNYIYGDPTTTADNWNDGVRLNYPPLNIRLYEPLPSEYIGPEETAEEAFDRVCNESGASKPKRDSVDIRVINDVINGTGSVPLTIASIPGEAFPVLNSLPAPDDDDHDGMPNDWEVANSLNPSDPEDRNNIGPDGIYFAQLRVASFNQTIKLVLIK